jgi:hypothetical protein
VSQGSTTCGLLWQVSVTDPAGGREGMPLSWGNS